MLVRMHVCVFVCVCVHASNSCFIWGGRVQRQIRVSRCHGPMGKSKSPDVLVKRAWRYSYRPLDSSSTCAEQAWVGVAKGGHTLVKQNKEEL